MLNKPFAEVIQSSLHGWLAQSWQWDQFPQFGALVTIKSKKRTLFGMVHQIQTGSMDPIRYPFPYQKTEEELKAEQPQIFEFLKTTFSCITVGYLEQNNVYYLLAPEPAKIHAFVEPLPANLAKQFFAHEKYLHMLFSLQGQVFNLDELLLAMLNQQAILGILSPDKVQTIMHTYSLLTGNDYRRIKLFLQRAEQIVR